MSTGSGAGLGDKFGVFLLGMLDGMAAMSLIYEDPKRSRRYEDYRRDKNKPTFPPSTTIPLTTSKVGVAKR
ncbi:hypothetical protein CU669_18395 [Paramagnetospirillum kuznetsovii]|uniref:Uncharacterized protein n=1 Tax=Paramagnetospirillum kuznetsovii TaxID=2053833 RepID=A0A364NTM0_9PROT|nr:hypothetical protein [Paramagnetospirillum kuznetsovii]RAU20424.1 hypothetical protein CU669_18395 [Paramagnetospirillum kuznetsovii]